MTTIEQLLDFYDKSTNWVDHPGERALWHLLTKFKDVLPEMNDYFHKAFRQTDVTDDEHADMAIWCLLQDAPVFWKLFEQVRKQKRKKREST